MFKLEKSQLLKYTDEKQQNTRNTYDCLAVEGGLNKKQKL